MMHVVVIPDSFKGSLSAREVAQVMYGVLQSIFPKATCTLLPFSDGGEGALDVLKDSISGPGPGKKATSSAEQVIKIRSIIENLGLSIATPAEARERLGIKGADQVKF